MYFNDQNAKDISEELAEAELGYTKWKYHYALMRNRPMSRGWVLFEFLVRILAGMQIKGLTRPEDITPYILDRDPLFTRLVIVDGLTDIEQDVNGENFDRFATMSTYEPADLAIIQARILEVCGSAAVFNRILNFYRAAAIRHRCQVKIRAKRHSCQVKIRGGVPHNRGSGA